MPRDPQTGRFIKAVAPETPRPAPQWAFWRWTRCPAWKPRVGLSDWGRCDRRKGHEGKHALARDIVVWF